jgi:hypothetical protein
MEELWDLRPPPPRPRTPPATSWWRGPDATRRPAAASCCGSPQTRAARPCRRRRRRAASRAAAARSPATAPSSPTRGLRGERGVEQESWGSLKAARASQPWRRRPQGRPRASAAKRRHAPGRPAVRSATYASAVGDGPPPGVAAASRPPKTTREEPTTVALWPLRREGCPFPPASGTRAHLTGVSSCGTGHRLGTAGLCETAAGADRPAFPLREKGRESPDRYGGAHEPCLGVPPSPPDDLT